jgi:hypothetical protein
MDGYRASFIHLRSTIMTDPTPPVPEPSYRPESGAPTPGNGSTPGYGAPGYGTPGTGATPAYGGAPAPQKTPVLSIISLVGGVLGILTGFFGWGLLFSIAGVVLGFFGRSREPQAKGLWLTGLITGFVGIAINAIVLVIAIIALVVAFSSSSYPGY